MPEQLQFPNMGQASTNFPQLLPGDIVLTHSPGFNFLRVLTGLYWNHVILIDEADFVGDKDYVILESINKGVAIGYLSFYQGCEIAIYRYKGITEEQQQEIRHSAKTRGRWRYDFLVPFKVLKRVGFKKFFELLVQFWSKSYPLKIPHIKDSYVVCSELVQEAYSFAEIPLISDEYILVPDQIALLPDKLNLVWRGKLTFPI